MDKHPFDFSDPEFAKRVRDLRNIAESIILKHRLNIGIREASSCDDPGDKFNFFVKDQDADRYILLQTVYEIPALVKEEIIQAYNNLKSNS